MKTETLFLCAALAVGSVVPAHAAHIGVSLNIGVPAPIVVRHAPPRPVVERVVVAPGPGYVWVAGHYTWANNAWVWVNGAWIVPPQPGAVWVAGRWEGHHRQWVEGHWEIATPVVVAQPGPPPPPPGGSDIYVEVAPPPPQTEVVVTSPGPGFIWVSGYWGWNAGRHVWIAGSWQRPPSGFHAWNAPRWEHRGRGYVFVRGGWH